MKKQILVTALLCTTTLFSIQTSEPKVFSTKTIQKKAPSFKKQNIVDMDKTLINGMNASLDKKFIEIQTLTKNTKSNAVTMTIFLNGENKILSGTLKDLEWGYSKDDQYIVLDKINVAFNIPWIDYVVHDSLKRDPYIVLPNYLSISDFLESIKPATQKLYDNVTPVTFNPLAYNFNKKFFEIKKFEIKNKTIKADIKLKGSKNLSFEIASYDLYTANKRKAIVLKKINLTSVSKPWISYLIKSWNNTLKVDFNEDLYKTLGSKDFTYKAPIIEKPIKKKASK